ncbi:MAG: type II toxin-antitoxin system VapC family toxin [Treponema sp.]|nr:type II toxin-antitoxin system VapC family toxin [Treponema sp.]
MKLLLDTHILVWFHTEDARLTTKALDLIMDDENLVYYSPLSVWESEIKHNLHPDDFTFSGKRLDELCKASGMIFLPLVSEQIFLLNSLKYSPTAKKTHKDPFDRMLICQAKAEGMYLLTHDELIPFYNEPCVISV